MTSDTMKLIFDDGAKETICLKDGAFAFFIIAIFLVSYALV